MVITTQPSDCSYSIDGILLHSIQILISLVLIVLFVRDQEVRERRQFLERQLTDKTLDPQLVFRGEFAKLFKLNSKGKKLLERLGLLATPDSKIFIQFSQLFFAKQSNDRDLSFKFITKEFEDNGLNPLVRFCEFGSQSNPSKFDTYQVTFYKLEDCYSFVIKKLGSKDFTVRQSSIGGRGSRRGE